MMLLPVIVIVFTATLTRGQDQGGQGGPLTSLLSTITTPKIGYAPGVHQAVSNTGSKPNLLNLLPGQDGGQQSGQSPLLVPFQAAQNLAHGFAQASGQLFNAAVTPFATFAQGVPGLGSGAGTAPSVINSITQNENTP